MVAGEALQANPIRKVIGMMQDMQKSVEAKFAEEKKLYEAFMCHCKSGAGSLQASIDTAASQIESLTSTIESETAQKSQMGQDVVQHKADLAAAKATIEEP